MVKIVWLPLPKERRVDGRLVLSVYVSPRLVLPGGATDGVLGDVDRMVDWPHYVNSLEFDVSFDGGPTVAAERKQVDPEWWYRLFSPDTPLHTHEIPDHSNTLIHTFPVQNILQFVEGAYQTIAEASPTDFPSVGLLDNFLEEVRPATHIREFISAYESVIGHEGEEAFNRALQPGTSIAGLSDVASDFIQAHRFYRRLEQEGTRDNEVAPDPPAKPGPDFHQMLAFLGDSPEVMRHLGLIVDLEFDDPGPDLTGVVRVEPSVVEPGVDIRPGTRYWIDDEHFLTAPKEWSLVEHGTLHLDWAHELFDFYQVDVDGAALKLIDLSANSAELRQLPELVSDTPGSAALPSLRSGGFTVSLRGRAVDLVALLDHETNLNQDIETDQAELGLEEVHRGYRIDVYDDETGRWHSLQDREGVHRFMGVPGQSDADTLGPLADEGFVRANAATSTRVDLTDPNDPNKPGKPDLYLHEAMFGWDGWSLVAPRPGKIIVEPDALDEDDEPLAVEKIEAESEFPLESEYRVASGSLPSLRFGRSYRIRARAVDLAGNGLAFREDELDDHATPERRYLRYEPVASPVVVRRHPDTEGESLERMVIRSDLGLSASEYVVQSHVVDATSGAAYTYTEDSQRHLAPPKAAVQTVELHGKLDSGFGPGGDSGSTYRLALKEEGTFLDTAVVDPATGSKDIDVSNDIEFVNPDELDIDDRRGAGLPQGVYLYRPGPDLKLPYLPDPLAAGVGLYDLPGHPGETVTVPFESGPGGWWDRAPFRVKLVGVAKGVAPSVEVIDGVLVVSLPQAERVVSKVSSVLDPEGRDVMAIWHLISQRARNTLEDESLGGRMWMLTPYRHLEFVHAVQRPLEAPTVGFQPARKLGETFTGFTGTVGNHAKSTSRIDVRAEWRDPIDSGAPGEEPVDGVDGRLLPGRKEAIPFGWDIAPFEDAAQLNLPAHLNGGNQRVSRHEFGDTKHRMVRYTPVATTRFREYFPEAITEDPTLIQQIGDEVELDIPNSARPAPPRVAYVIPTFGWEEEGADDGKTLTRKRRGGGLRVYLERPWYSSGDGELLGVVTLPPPRRIAPERVFAGEAIAVEHLGTALVERSLSVTDTARLVESPTILALEIASVSAKPYVTTWGRDPIWASADPKAIAQHIDFPTRTSHSRSGLSILEAPGASVAVAAHEVHYDPHRELWYADIEASAGNAYFPFIRLALARFQPSSVTGAHLSPVVVTDFTQLTADRTAKVSVEGPEATVSVSGIAPYNLVAARMASGLANLDLGQSRRMSVTVQRRDPGVESDMAWADVGTEVFLSLVSRGGLLGRVLTNQRTWRGKVTVPKRATAGEGLRLLIREYEYFFTDEDPDIHLPHIHAWSPSGFVRSRVVYADIFPL